MIHLGYKLTIERKFTDGKIFPGSLTEQTPIAYEIGKWTVPEVGKIFCFDDINKALAFKKASYPGADVWLVQMINPVHSSVRGPTAFYHNQIQFWETYELALKDGSYDSLRRNSYPAPPGTIFADKVKLINLIDDSLLSLD